MATYALKCGALAILLLAPISSHAQGVVGGAANGADEGGAAGGPVGAVVGGVLGGVGGLIGVDQRPRFHEYVLREHPMSYRYDEQVQVGVVLPPEGVEYYDVPPDYGVRGYRYTVVNNEVVLVDPRTHRIVEVID
jgi:uncharacterized protein DUF1236